MRASTPTLAVGPTLVNKFAHEHGLIMRPVADSALLLSAADLRPRRKSPTCSAVSAGRCKDTHEWLKREGHA